MAQLLLINPKGRTKMATRKPRSAAQKAATRRMVAANKSRKGRRAAVKHIAASAPSRRTKNAPSARLIRRRSANIVQGYFPNPAKRRRYKRNPANLSLSVKSIGAMGMTALQGAGGALLVNTALNYVPFLPAALNSGNGKYLTRAGAAIALGVLGEKVLPRGMAQNMAVGALTVALHDLLLGLAATAAPTLKLGDVGDYDTGVSEYVPALENMAGVTSFTDVYSPVGEYVR